VVGAVWGTVSHDFTNGCPSEDQAVSSSWDVDLELGRRAGGFLLAERLTMAKPNAACC
jgi:hypothetical protein